MPHDLTPRQVEVVRLISMGCSNVEIGRILGLATSTVDVHRVMAMEKAGVSKAALLTRWAIKNRVTSLSDTLAATEKRRRGRKRDGWS
jgi:DNA-binding CsgD family transcriptional regulator